MLEKKQKTARILVCGPRDYEAYPTVARAIGITISELMEKGYNNFIVVHGDAPGADSMAREFTNIVGPSLHARGISIKHEANPAKWYEHDANCKHAPSARCPAAGPRRNRLMVAKGAEVCIYLKGPCTRTWCKQPKPHPSHGAEGCAKLARAANIEVKTF